MMDLSVMIIQLYAEKTPEEIEKLLALVETKSTEYYAHTWQDVTVELLADQEVQLNLIRTLYQSSFSYSGVVDEILRSLDEWSERTLIFEHLSSNDNIFYRRFYTFLGFLNFADIEFKRKMRLLDSELLVLACHWDIPIYVNVQSHFAEFAQINALKKEALLFANAIAANQTELGEERKELKTIAQWVKAFDEHEGATFEERVDTFLSEQFEATRLSEADSNILGKILSLYWSLKGSFIWQEIVNSHTAGYEQVEKKNVRSVDDHYIQLLYEGTEQDIVEWLQDYEETVHWIDLTGKSEAFVKKILFVLSEKVDLQNQQQVELVIKFINKLKERGLELIDEVLYFDEEDHSFHWDEELIFAESEEETPASSEGADDNKESDELKKLKDSFAQ